MDNKKFKIGDLVLVKELSDPCWYPSYVANLKELEESIVGKIFEINNIEHFEGDYEYWIDAEFTIVPPSGFGMNYTDTPVFKEDQLELVFTI